MGELVTVTADGARWHDVAHSAKRSASRIQAGFPLRLMIHRGDVLSRE